MKSPESNPRETPLSITGSWRHLSGLLKSFRKKKLTAAEKQQQLKESLKNRLQKTSVEEFPPSSFRLLSTELRASGDYSEAERIAGIGVEFHPQDRWLAMEHAHAAKECGDLEKIATYWKRATQIGTSHDPPPAKAFIKWAEALVGLGRLEEADDAVAEGRVWHPTNAHLLELSGKIHLSSGRTAAAINVWKSLLAEHPNHNPESTYFRLHQSYLTEGMLSQAKSTLATGITLLPDSQKLLNATLDLEKITSPDLKIQSNSISELAILDLAISFPDECRNFSNQLCSLLGFHSYVPQPTHESSTHESHTIAVWRHADSHLDRISIGHAARSGKPLLFLDQSPVYSAAFTQMRGNVISVISSPEISYQNSTKPSNFENTLNSDSFQLSDSERTHSHLEIESIVLHHEEIRKHLLPINTHKEQKKKRVLLIDQAISDPSLHLGLSGKMAFIRMLDYTRSLEDHEIWVARDSNSLPNSQFYISALLSKNTEIHLHFVDPAPWNSQLFDSFEKVLVATSNIGFEAKMAGKEVHCFGVPYYSGWGFTNDHVIVPRRKKQRTLEEVFHVYHIKNTIHLQKEVSLIEHQVDLEEPSTLIPLETRNESRTQNSEEPPALKILMIIPSGRFGATGRYIQTLARSLQYQGCSVMVLAEAGQARTENGIRWLPLSFEGSSLSKNIRNSVKKFGPNIIYENGVRSRAQRAALELIIMTGARLAMQSEDDDIQVHTAQHGESIGNNLATIDTPQITTQQLNDYLYNKIDLHHSLDIFLEPSLDRWIEPVSRALCYRLASLHTAIWHPFAERLSTQYGTPTLVVPPVASKADFERIQFSKEERAEVLVTYGIKHESTVIFIGGALYSYSPEFSLFLDALNIAAEQNTASISLVITGTRSSMPVTKMCREKLLPEIGFHTLALASDDHYMEMLKACDVICSPGYPDSFNRYRLPSRLVKGMAMAKPVLTSVCGFGESLEHGFNAFLMDGTDPQDWASSIILSLNPEERKKVGENGKQFALEHFDSDQVATKLKSAFEKTLSSPGKLLQDSIRPDHKRSEQKLNSTALRRNRYDSTMQDAITCIEAEDKPLDTVIHVGAGAGGEFEDYIRLSAKRIILVEPLPCHIKHLKNLAGNDGRIEIIPAVVSQEDGPTKGFVTGPISEHLSGENEFHILYPHEYLQKLRSFEIKNEETYTATTLDKIGEDIVDYQANHVLMLELNGDEENILQKSSHILEKFRWVALRIILPTGTSCETRIENITRLFAARGLVQIPTQPNHVDIGKIFVFHRYELSR